MLFPWYAERQKSIEIQIYFDNSCIKGHFDWVHVGKHLLHSNLNGNETNVTKMTASKSLCDLNQTVRFVFYTEMAPNRRTLGKKPE